MLFNHCLIIVRGGGDLASGVIYRLWKAGFPVVVTELPQPLVIRRPVAFASAVFDGMVTVEDVTACRVEHAEDARGVLESGSVPVLVDPDGACVRMLQPGVVIDARLSKRVLDTRIDLASLVVALGPGFEAGRDCHAVVETKRGHTLGRVIWQGMAVPDSGQPGEVLGHSSERVLRAPAAGYVQGHAAIGDMLAAGALVAEVSGQSITAPFGGVLRGLIHPSVQVVAGMKIGDMDPRGDRSYCFTLSDKALAVGGGVVEAVLSAPQIAARLTGLMP